MDLLEKIKDDLAQATDLVENAAQEERDYYDNMSDNLKGGDKGTAAEDAATNLEDVHSALNELDLDDLISKIDDARGAA